MFHYMILYDMISLYIYSISKIWNPPYLYHSLDECCNPPGIPQDPHKDPMKTSRNSTSIWNFTAIYWDTTNIYHQPGRILLSGMSDQVPYRWYFNRFNMAGKSPNFLENSPQLWDEHLIDEDRCVSMWSYVFAKRIPGWKLACQTCTVWCRIPRSWSALKNAHISVNFILGGVSKFHILMILRTSFLPSISRVTWVFFVGKCTFPSKKMMFIV